MKHVIVTMSPFNLWYAGMVGVSRRTKGIGKGGTYGVDNAAAGWGNDCDAAVAEAALARHLNVWWDGAMMDFTAADVGAQIEVRSTRHAKGCLLLHKKDRDHHPFVLVITAGEPHIKLAGWLYGAEGKQAEFWSDKGNGRPAYFVPQDNLHPMSELPK